MFLAALCVIMHSIYYCTDINHSLLHAMYIGFTATMKYMYPDDQQNAKRTETNVNNASDFLFSHKKTVSI